MGNVQCPLRCVWLVIINSSMSKKHALFCPLHTSLIIRSYPFPPRSLTLAFASSAFPVQRAAEVEVVTGRSWQSLKSVVQLEGYSRSRREDWGVVLSLDIVLINRSCSLTVLTAVDYTSDRPFDPDIPYSRGDRRVLPGRYAEGFALFLWFGAWCPIGSSVGCLPISSRICWTIL